jgi:pyrroloquinoline quinone (PQQ) biosynthesis protein C
MADTNDTSRAFRMELKQIQKQHPLFQKIHPFWRDCFRGRLGVEEIRRWALDVNPLVGVFSRLYIQVAAHCESERALTFLAETIYEETGSGNEMESHPLLFRNFLKSLGVAEEEIPRNATTEAGQKLIDYSWKIVCDGTFVEGLSLVGLGIERPLPTFFKMISNSFQKHLGMTEADVRFFAVHTVADIRHSQLAARNVAEEARTKAEQQAVATILKRVWDLQLEQLNELTTKCRPAEVSNGA